MAKLKVIATGLLWAILLATMMGCGRERLPPDFRDTPFVMEVLWQTDSGQLEGVVTAEGDGRLELELISPEAVRGIVCVAEGEKHLVRCGELVADGSGMESLFSMMALSLPAGERRAICETQWRGEEVLYVELEQESRVELYVEKESGVPRAIRQGEITLEILSFRALPKEV